MDDHALQSSSGNLIHGENTSGSNDNRHTGRDNSVAGREELEMETVAGRSSAAEDTSSPKDKTEDEEGFGALLEAAEDEEKRQQMVTDRIKKSFDELTGRALSLEMQLEESKEKIYVLDWEMYKASNAHNGNIGGKFALSCCGAIDNHEEDFHRAILKVTREFNSVKEKFEQIVKADEGSDAEAKEEVKMDEEDADEKKDAASVDGKGVEGTKVKEDAKKASKLRKEEVEVQIAALREAVKQQDNQKIRQVTLSLDKIYKDIKTHVLSLESDLKSSDEKVKEVTRELKHWENCNYKVHAKNLMATVYLHHLLGCPYDGWYDFPITGFELFGGVFSGMKKLVERKKNEEGAAARDESGGAND